MATIAENVIAAGSGNRPPMLEKGMYDSWKTHILLYIRGKENEEMLIDLIENGTYQLLPEIRVKAVDGVIDIKSEWSRFVTTDKQARDLHSVNFDQLYAFLKHNERDAKEFREMRQQFPDPLALPANTYNPPPLYSSQHIHYAPTVVHQPSTLQPDTEFFVPTFLPTDDPIASLNKAMIFLSFAYSSRYPPINNQLRTSSNPRTHATIQNGQVMVQNVQGRQSQGYTGSAGKNQALGAITLNGLRIRLLDQAQEAGVVLNDEQHDFLADSLEETNDYEDLQLQATTISKADHVDAYDSECDDEATTNAIFMANLSLVGSINDDTVEPQPEYIENIVSNNEAYDELTSNNNVISYADCMVTIGNDEDNYVPPPVQNNYRILSIIEHMKTQVEKCSMKQPVLYNGNVLIEKHNPVLVCDTEETLILTEESRLKMLEKQTVINTKLIDYSKLNKLYDDLVPQKQLSAEQLYWSSTPSPPESVSKPAKVFPKKLPSTGQVLKNLNNARDLLARALKPLDEHIGRASKFAERIQELLVYVSASCPFTQSGNEKWAPTTSHKKNNKPYVDASSTKQTIETIIQKNVVKQNTRKTNNTMLPSTGKVSSTHASGSKPKSNTKNDRIWRTSSRSKKNKVEAHHRKFKSRANKSNLVSNCNANVKNVALSNNFDTICLSYKECLFSVNHDACVVQYLKKMQKRKMVKSAKQKVKKIVLWYLDSRCSKHMTGHHDKLINFVSKFIGLGHNLFSIGKFCDSDLDVEDVGITHHTSTTRTPQQNGIIERRNRTLVEVARTMLIFSKSLLFLWAEAVATACYTQNRSLIHTRYNKTPYELLKDHKPKLKHLHVLVLYVIQQMILRILGNFSLKQTLKSSSVIHHPIRRPELHGLTSGHISSRLVLKHVASTSAKPPTKNEWDLLFQPMFDEYFKSPSAVSTLISATTLLLSDTARASSSTTSIHKDALSLSNLPNIKSINSPINSTNVEPHKEVVEFDSDAFTSPFAP
ncbi:retrovirus-related pol polyprotein from transposon TNT 1-94 [Tanacetum coccineum]